MSVHNSKINFWGFFGKLATIIGVIWALTQLYNYYIKEDYKISCKGAHYPFEIAPDIKRTLTDYVNRRAIEKSYYTYFKDGSRMDSIQKIEATLLRIEKMHSSNLSSFYYKLSQVKNDYTHFQNYYSTFLFEDYKSFWCFTITNDGDKPIEELMLELPYNGYYQIISKSDISKTGPFKNQIELGVLKAKHDIIIKVWAKNPLYEILNYDEEKTRITHKYGWSAVQYSKEANGFALWYMTNEFSGIILLTSFAILILVILYSRSLFPLLLRKINNKN